MKDADDGSVVARGDGKDAAGAAVGVLIAAGRVELDEDAVALHGSGKHGGGDEDVAVAGRFAGGADEAEAVAMEVEAAGEDAVRQGRVGDGRRSLPGEMRAGSLLVGFLPDWWARRAEVVFCAGIGVWQC